MTDDASYIDHDHLPATAHRPPAQQAAPAAQPVSVLDQDPATFKQHAQRRLENYDALKEYLRTLLVPNHDFGKMHVMPRDKCDRGNRCDNPRHWSDNQLWDPGADKILGLLGLAVEYPGEDDYRRAALKGVDLKHIIMKAMIVNAGGVVLAQGQGACSMHEMKGDLNRALKRAGKRARLEAVHRLPGVSALFEDGFFDQIPAQSNTLEKRQARVDPNSSGRWNTGAVLEEMPIGKTLKGKRFTEMKEGALNWILENMTDKPDIVNAASRELDRRRLQEPAPSQHRAASPGITVPDDDEDFSWFDNMPAGDGGAADDGPPPDSYFNR